MPSKFEGLGMGRLGADQYASGSGLGKGLLGIGLYKAGLIDDIDDAFNPESALRQKVKGYFSTGPRSEPAPVEDRSTGAIPGTGPNENARAMIPPTPVAPPAAAPVPPAPVAPAVQNGPPANNEHLVDHVIGANPSDTFVSQNTLAPRDTSQDAQLLAMASQPVSPPSQPVGQQGGGGGSIMQAVLPQLAKLIFA
jgi:hypothetical protein